jgi:hypothetical protein
MFFPEATHLNVSPSSLKLEASMDTYSKMRLEKTAVFKKFESKTKTNNAMRNLDRSQY